MGLDENIVSIIQELVQFLESLGNVELPTAINTMRENLLSRSKIAIHAFSSQRSLPTEPYLDMRVGKELSFLDETAETEEYVNADNRQSDLSKDYAYESFAELQEEPRTPVTKNTSKNAVIQDVLSIYRSFSIEQTKNASHKCGPLDIKERKKFFLFEQYRKCWAGLVGSHLIMYKDVKDNRPYEILSVRDYKSRPAPETITNDPRKSEKAFEIVSPDNTTMLFIARTPKDMEQWVAAICQFGSNENNTKLQSTTNHEYMIKKSESDVAANDFILIENYQDVSIRGSSTEVSPKRSVMSEKDVDTKKEKDRFDSPTKDTIQSDDIPPSLPIRLPRRLPSIPVNFQKPYDPADDMDDDIYQKIQDVKTYENIKNTKRTIPDAKKDDHELYDDVPAVNKNTWAMMRFEVEGKKSSVLNAVNELETQETYDDTIRLDCNDQNENSRQQVLTKLPGDTFRQKPLSLSDQGEPLCYDDVHDVAPQVKPKKQRQKGKEELQSTPEGTIQKKSFFSRVMRRESSKKEEKKSKPSSPLTLTYFEDIPMYDDISSFVAGIIPYSIEPQRSTPIQTEESSEYNLPPPPKPIYNSPAAANLRSEPIEEYYSDIANLQANGMDRNKGETVKQNSEDRTIIPKYNKVTLPIIDKEELMNSEHYQTPTNDPVVAPIQNEEVEEDLYDDVVIVAAKARLRGLTMKEDEANGNKTNSFCSPERKLWNPFKAGWKNKVTEDSSLEINKKSNDCITTSEEVYDDCLLLTNGTHGVERKN